MGFRPPWRAALSKCFALRSPHGAAVFDLLRLPFVLDRQTVARGFRAQDEFIDLCVQRLRVSMRRPLDEKSDVERDYRHRRVPLESLRRQKEPAKNEQGRGDEGAGMRDGDPGFRQGNREAVPEGPVVTRA